MSYAYWTEILKAALAGLSKNWYLGKKQIVKRAISIADETQEELYETD